LQPGSFAAEATERSIDLLIRSAQADSASPELERSLLRNGAFAYWRSHRREAANLKKLSNYCSIDDANELATPEVFILASESEHTSLQLIYEIRNRASTLGRNQVRTFDHLLSGQSAAATATACGCSLRMISTYRAQIRSIAADVLGHLYCVPAGTRVT